MLYNNFILQNEMGRISSWLDNPSVIEYFRTQLGAFDRQNQNNVSLSFKKTFLAILGTTNDSNSNVIDDIINYNILKEEISEATLRKKRQLINPIAFLIANFNLVDSFYQYMYSDSSIITPKEHLIAVDTTTIKLPNTKEMLRIFGGQKSQNNHITPMARISIIYDVSTGIIIDIILAPYNTSERDMLIAHLKVLDSLNIPNYKIILLADRGYPGDYVFNVIESYGFKYIFRASKEHNNFVKRFTSPEQIVTYPSGRKQRIFKINLSKEPEFLLTNIYDNDKKVGYFYKRYGARWEIELSFRFIKSLYGTKLKAFTYENINTISQIVYATSLMSNLTTLSRHIMDQRIKKHERTNRRSKRNGQTNKTKFFNKTKILIIQSIYLNDITKLTDKIMKLKLSDLISYIKPGRWAERYELQIIKKRKKDDKKKGKRNKNHPNK